MVAIVLIGSPGSGKTTLARSEATDLGITPVISGDIARSMAQRDRDAQDALSVGEMAPELAMRTAVQAEIEAAVVTTGDFVIDGFPRTVEQLYIFESIPQIRPVYFLLDIDPLICLRRIVARKREHDHPDAVGTRFRAFEELTRPMLDILHYNINALDGNLPTSILLDQVGADYLTEKHRDS